MSDRPKPGPTPARHALVLTLVVWGADIASNVVPGLFSGQILAPIWIRALMFAALGLGLSYLVHRGIVAVRGRSAVVRFASLVAMAIACGALSSLADVTLGARLREMVGGPAPTADPARFFFLWISNLFAYAWMFALVGSIYLMLDAIRAAMERERQLADARAAAAEAEAAATAARLAALRYQLNPHFLFNTLNAVSSAVITARNAEAESMLEKLAEFLRVTLAADPAGLIPLEDELATIQAYLEIESVRFRDRLGVDFSCPDDLRGAVTPSFILQPLIENAIKHGVSRATDAVTIRLEVTRDGDDLVVLVEDDALRVGDPARGVGVGLRNIRQRLEALYGPRGVLQTTARERGFLAMVRLPLSWSTRPQAVEAA